MYEINGSKYITREELIEAGENYQAELIEFLALVSSGKCTKEDIEAYNEKRFGFSDAVNEFWNHVDRLEHIKNRTKPLENVTWGNPWDGTPGAAYIEASKEECRAYKLA